MPAKVLVPVLGRPILAHLLERLTRATRVDQIVLAVPSASADDDLATFAAAHGVSCYRGSEHDVLDRCYRASEEAGATVVVRITGDCPLVDPGLVDRLIHLLLERDVDDVRTGEHFPDGFDVEVCTFDALRRAWQHATDPYDREHVTPYVHRDPRNRILIVDHDEDLSFQRVTLDQPEDLDVITKVFETFGHNQFTFDDVTTLMQRQPELFRANRNLSRNEGSTMGTGPKLWRRARTIIPAGNMLLSKRGEMHLPEGWPAYFSRAKGCTVWDLDDREYLDVGLMGVGTSILGYGHPKVDEAVRKVVEAGNMSTLNCPEEVALAEMLVGLHPWSEMALFARSGGEACAVAVRLGRAASGRDGVAFCGYHGWHDWYLSANLADDSALDGHLLPGLRHAGVPRGLAGTAKPFAYNDLASLEGLMRGGDVGTVFMEVERSIEPDPGFLEGARELATRHDAVLVFDECTSGFRRTLGGLHLHYGVEPDLAVFGKTLGNGYAISAVIGRASVMEVALDTFISSTFWTERIGPTAAIAALGSMREEGAPERIDAIGRHVRRRWSEVAAAAGLEIETMGVPSLGSFAVPHLDPVATRTFVTQELLANGFLAGVALYACIAHDNEVLDAYFEQLEPVFAALSSCGSTEDLLRRLPNGPAWGGFRRLA